MSRVKNDDFYAIYDWMIADLGLTGRELQVYAIIYKFTQGGETEFDGSLTYMAEWLGTSKHTVINVLKSLINKGLLKKRQIDTPNGKRNYYTCIVPTFNKNAIDGN